MSPAQVVQHYLDQVQPRKQGEMGFYASRPTLHDAIQTAARAVGADGKRHPHQYRITRAALSAVEGALIQLDYAGMESFDALFEAVRQALSPIKGIGELMIYDTVHRLGAFLHLQPEHVYLHAGVRVGAKALGLGKGKDKLAMTELPRPFQKLEPAEVEDCLCIYKAQLAAWAGIPAYRAKTVRHIYRRAAWVRDARRVRTADEEQADLGVP